MHLYYKNFLSSLFATLNNAQSIKAAAADTLSPLAKRLIEGAIAFDLDRAAHIDTHFSFETISRNFNTPNFAENDKLKSADWADDSYNPLEAGEQWNAGRRATDSGIIYPLDKQNHPVNPYFNTGLHGRGTLGLYGPNHAVDNGMIVIKDDDTGAPTFYALGIERLYDNNAPALAGGFAEYTKNPAGSYDFNNDAATLTRTKEFFEEMVSGSVPIDPENLNKVEERISKDIANHCATRGIQSLPPQEITEIRGHVETAIKLEQVQQKDPDFWARLQAEIAKGKEAYAGPVMADPRNTNTAWIETRLSWIMMDDEKWSDIIGDDPAYDYHLAAGDDAGKIVYHKLTPDLIEKSFASHGSFFVYLASAYILDCIENGREIPSSMINQFESVADYLEQKQAQGLQTPPPALKPV